MAKSKLYQFYSIHLLIIGAFCKLSQSLQEIKCLDGKLPLLDENRSLFPCQRGCPTTFYCEDQHLEQNISICCPNSTEIAAAAAAGQEIAIKSTILRGKKDIEFQLESSSELRRTMSCERFPYKSTCQNNTETSSQPQAKWYFDVQTLSCEMYPLGMCEDDPLEELALRSRAECEERCDVANVKSALESLSEGNSINGGQEVFHFSRFPNAGQIAIDDVVQESKHVRGRPFAIEPPTDLFHVIHVPSDSHVIRRNQKNRTRKEEFEENELLTTDSSDETTESVPTVTSDILTVLEDVNDDSEGSGTEEPEIRLNVTVQEASGSTEIGESQKFESDGRVDTIERQQRKKSLKSMEDSFERFYQRARELVVCAQTSYKLLCSSGKPSQFVYRWEKVNGVCQSFPYGYCWHEKNVAHPRTRAECEQFCT